MKRASCFLVGLSCALLFAAPADARRFRIPWFGSSESIDLVYDLPDEEPFVMEGRNVDIGYLNSPRGNSYVLYSGDRFRRLKDDDIVMLTGALGFDPTAEYRKQYAADHADEVAADKAERAHKDDLINEGRMLERKPGESSASFAARTRAFVEEHRSSSGSASASETREVKSGGGALGFGTIAVLLVILVAIGRKLFAGVPARVASVEAKARDEEGPDLQSFDERVALRLAELQAGGQGGAKPQTVPEAGFAAASPQPVPRAGGFGRKTA